jgi:diketogulonate reductase-like aldo/keto reductase
MPVLGLGTWQLDNQTADTIALALKLGYRMIDTSGDYGTQPGISEGLKQSGVGRDSYYLVTKVEETDDAYEATQQNVQELQLTYADLMLIHRPPSTGFGKELWQGLQRARDEGLTKDIGVSNYSVEHMEALGRASGELPAVNQIEWSPFGHSEDMLQYCHDHGIIIQAYSPLTRAHRLDNDLLDTMAAGYHKSAAQLIIRWNLQLGTVPIVKANQPEHLRQNLEVFDFEISADDMARLDGLNEHYSSLS